MFYFLTFLFAVFMSIVQIGIRQRVKTGQTLSRIQTNVAASYITISRRIGKNIYRILGLMFIVGLTIGALMHGAWIVASALMFYNYFALRAMELIDRTQFEAVNRDGQKDPDGAYLRPIIA